MRQSAWLASVPGPGPSATTKTKRLTRMQQLAEAGAQAPLPPLWRGEYLLGYLWDAGPLMRGGMEPAPLSCTELGAWQEASGVELQPWESALLRRLSREYLAEATQASASDSPAPWAAAPDAGLDREAVSRRIGQQFKAMIMAQRARGQAC